MKDKRLSTEIRHNKGYLAHLVLNGLATVALSLTIALMAATVISNVFIGGQGLRSVLPTLFALLAGVAARAVLNYYFSLYFRNAAADIKRRVLARYADSLLRRGPVLKEGKNSGGGAALAGEAAEQLEPYYFEYLPALYALMLSLPLILAAVACFDVVSFLIMLVTGPVLPFFLYLIGKESEKTSRARLQSLTRLGGGLNDILSGLKTLKLFGKTAAARSNVASMSDGFRRVTMQVLRVSFLSAFVLELAATISTAIIAVTLGTRLIYGGISFFACFFILLMTPDYFMAIRRFGAKFHVAQNAKSAAEILLKSEDTGEKSEEPGQTLPFPDREAEVVFRDVTCSYGPNEPAVRCEPAVRNINLRLRPGEITALVGMSGAGKTTIANALLKLITPVAGEITVGGTSLTDIDTEDLRKNIAYIPQRPYIFKDTLKNNIALPKPDATEAELQGAIRDALLEELIASLPGGLDKEVADLALNFSAGERQRIAIARALLKNAPIIIVDEAVSAQDRENERLLTRAFQRLSRDKAVLIIAHRLETVMSADRICMLDGGVIVEEGSHETLMAKNGRYSELVRSWG